MLPSVVVRQFDSQEHGPPGNVRSEAFAATAEALRMRRDSLGFEVEMDSDGNVRGNGLTVPRSWFVPVLLQGFHRGLAQ